MPVIACQAHLYFISSYITLAILLLKFFQSLLESAFIACPESPDHFSRILMIAVDHHIQEQSNIRVRVFCEHPFQSIMVDTVKVFPHITFEDPAIRAMFTIKRSQETVQPIYRKMRPFPFAAGRAVVDQSFLEKRLQQVVAKAVLNDPVAERQRHRLVYAESRFVFHSPGMSKSNPVLSESCPDLSKICT